MTRDMDLVRKIVFALEEREPGTRPSPVPIDGFSDQVVTEHLKLMMEAGLIEAVERKSLSSPTTVLVKRLKWKGHDFADAARSETLWAKAKRQIKEKAGSVTIEVMTEYLKHLGKEALGIA
jgi:predicted transcriptional regulator